MPKHNYVENDAVIDPNLGGYARLRGHTLFGGGPAATCLGSSTPEPAAGLSRIGKSINDPATQQYMHNKLEEIARQRLLAEAVDASIPEAGVVAIMNQF